MNMWVLVQNMLKQQWELKLPLLITKARNYASAATGRLQPKDSNTERSIQEAYLMGYREGYWEGVIDVLDCGTPSSVIEQADITLH